MKITTPFVLCSLALSAGCAMLQPKPQSRTDEYIAANDLAGLRAVCGGSFTSVSEHDRQRACDEVARRDNTDADKIAKLSCGELEPREGENSPQQRLGLQSMPKQPLAKKLAECKMYGLMLGGYYQLDRADLAPTFASGEGAAFLRQAITEPGYQADTGAMLIVEELDPKASSREYLDLVAAQDHLTRGDVAFDYLVRARHPRALALLPSLLDSQLPGERIQGCTAAKRLGAKEMRARVERLAASDPYAVADRDDGAGADPNQTTVTWPVRTACGSAVEALK